MNRDYKSYAAMMKALADETRVKIFDMISHSELCACKILEEFNITQPTLSYHMKILTDCGLVNGRRDGVWMKYTINEGKLEFLQELFTGIDLNVGAQSQCAGKC